MCSPYGLLSPVDKKSYEMGYTPKEFKKTLLGQFSTNTSYKVEPLTDSSWSVTDDSENFLANIEIAVGHPRNIALLTLPVLILILLSNSQMKSSNKRLQDCFLNTFTKVVVKKPCSCPYE